jgi:type I restriction enzyme, R subunit
MLIWGYLHNPSKSFKSTLDEILDQNLPDSYDRAIFIAKRDRIFNLLYSLASAGQKWVA